VPAVLHISRESRGEGLKFYKPFEADAFEAKCVNLDIDTLHFRRCLCHDYSPSARTLGGLFPGSIGRMGNTIIEALANAKSVKNITSLALCDCQILDFECANRHLWVPVFKKFESLREIVFMTIRTTGFVEALGSDGGDREDGVAEMLRLTPERLRAEGVYEVHPAEVEEKSHMWNKMKSSVNFKKLLGRATETEEALVVPIVRCVVLANGEVAWKQIIETDSTELQASNPYSYWNMFMFGAPSRGPGRQNTSARSAHSVCETGCTISGRYIT